MIIHNHISMGLWVRSVPWYRSTLNQLAVDRVEAHALLICLCVSAAQKVPPKRKFYIELGDRGYSSRKYSSSTTGTKSGLAANILPLLRAR